MNKAVCICVPARNEAARLPILLGALAAQTYTGTIHVALCINNSDDESASIAADLATHRGSRLNVRIDGCVLAPDEAHVGTARRRAMHVGSDIVGDRGVLISTDADCRPPDGWIAANLAAMDAGADVVGGRIVLDNLEPVSMAVMSVVTQFDRYWAMVREIEDAIDPVPHDPSPRHGDHTGASLAIGADMYHAIGGVPAIPCGEDRALVTAAVAAGARLVHPLPVWTRVSARTEGRAAGGMATSMAELADTINDGGAPRVAALEHWARRAAWRREERRQKGISAMLAHESRLPPMPKDMALWDVVR
ncbi:glycosyltransferase [Sphingomonas radiodurans]|uniref:glycosyltransferase n=1 Tax=Sphingomonas radiodurans TaxID=2890321 RepID=UPI001E58899F|nr:glycosyltransferase [Sphingomonas radiodurans]WBH15838.1 glycosyltransferase [Sphingomonas radiodurans]